MYAYEYNGITKPAALYRSRLRVRVLEQKLDVLEFATLFLPPLNVLLCTYPSTLFFSQIPARPFSDRVGLQTSPLKPKSLRHTQYITHVMMSVNAVAQRDSTQQHEQAHLASGTLCSTYNVQCQRCNRQGLNRR